eukprot:GHVN01053254.1.p1 GENE.GHVN01053254.1~~GHVN01053254.1.p1  ORF type:complete len:120 (-),score=18.99 GHVN01053254.1:72-431(-)
MFCGLQVRQTPTSITMDEQQYAKGLVAITGGSGDWWVSCCGWPPKREVTWLSMSVLRDGRLPTPQKTTCSLPRRYGRRQKFQDCNLMFTVVEEHQLEALLSKTLKEASHNGYVFLMEIP